MSDSTAQSDCFKECPNCQHRWPDRDTFLSDPDITLVGYQVNYGELKAGFFLFNHDTDACGTSMAVTVDKFEDVQDGPVFEESRHGRPDCPGYCDHSGKLEACYAKCECRYVRDVLQVLKTWPKKG